MIPFFQAHYFLIGPLTIQVWGLFVATGVLAAVYLGRKLTNKYLLSEDVFLDIAVWSLFSGLIFGRVFHILFYNLDYYITYPSEIYRFWHGGSSSLGGFFGAVLGSYIFFKVRRFKMSDFYPYLDITIISLWLGMAIGRLGCFAIHDHPGLLSNFILAVKFPGGSRLDLGLLEAIFNAAIFGLYYSNFDKFIKKRWGLVAIYSSMTYAAGRFFLDFLRARDLQVSDVRYLSLTPAQWGMMLIFLALTFVLFSDRIRQVFKKES
jgi:phosphatidylglycerol:prolipoprotein diacylglycerol transferase